LFEHDLAATARRTWRVTSPRSAELELELARAAPVGITRLQEDITRGQSIAKYSVYGASDDAWRPLARGTTIGYTKLDRFTPVSVRRLKVVIEESLTTPSPLTVKAYATE
jgi:alpha-L-fucosidase